MKQFQALAIFYEPFTMGGDVWRKVRYKVDGEEHQLIIKRGKKSEKHKVFSTKRRKKYILHEITTGGFICREDTAKKALSKAKKLIEETPDFRQQMKTLGSINSHKEVSATEAYRRLERSKPREQ